MDDLELERRKRQRVTILGNWDEIAERLTCGESIDLEAFVPSDDRRIKKNAAIVEMLENKQKL